MLRRIGQVFGIARDTHHATQASGMAAVGAAFTSLLEKPNDATLIEAIAGRLHVDGDAVAVPTQQNSPALLVGLIERFLGLDRLGAALTGVIAAGRDPDAGAAVKVRAAFLNRPDARPDAVTWAALGVYRPGPTGGRTTA